MNSDNICRFIIPRDEGNIEIVNFFFENDTAEREEQKYTAHRMYLVSKGQGELITSSQHVEISSGMLFFTFADIPFSVKDKGGLNYYCITFSGGRADKLLRRFNITPAYSTFYGFEGLVPLWQDSLLRSNDENADLLSESLILYAFSKLKKTELQTGALVSFVVNYLEKNFTRHDLTLTEVAAKARYNEKYLSHIFKKQFGMGFSEYLRLLRIKHSVMLIEHGVTTVKNVAFLSGFSDPLYFSKVFTEAVGISPSKYKSK